MPQRQSSMIPECISSIQLNHSSSMCMSRWVDTVLASAAPCPPHTLQVPYLSVAKQPFLTLHVLFRSSWSWAGRRCGELDALRIWNQPMNDRGPQPHYQPAIWNLISPSIFLSVNQNVPQCGAWIEPRNQVPQQPSSVRISEGSLLCTTSKSSSPSRGHHQSPWSVPYHPREEICSDVQSR